MLAVTTIEKTITNETTNPSTSQDKHYLAGRLWALRYAVKQYSQLGNIKAIKAHLQAQKVEAQNKVEDTNLYPENREWCAGIASGFHTVLSRGSK